MSLLILCERLPSKPSLGGGFRTSRILTSSATTDESEIVELGDLVLHDRGAVSQFPAAVLVVARLDGDQGAVGDLVEGHDLEGHW